MTDPPTNSATADTGQRTRRFVYAAVIAVAAGQGLASIQTATILYSPARWPDPKPAHSPMFSANDRSRWCTVWSLVERGTYQIDEITQVPGWDTIDKVRFQDHFYSSKPPLLSTVVAGIYKAVKRVSGLDLLKQTHEAVHTILLIVNWLPWVIALSLLAGMGERYAQTDWSRYFLIVAAAGGTYLTTFLTTFNNHTVAATALVFSLAPALRIAIDGNRAWWRFAAAGFFAAWTVCNELPACVYGVIVFLWLLRLSPKQTILAFGPAALVPLAGFFYTNYLCTGGIKPFYAGFGSELYRYVVDGVPSYWMNPSAVDIGESSGWVYLWHCTFGHHGIFSLTPVFLVTLAGWVGIRKWKDSPMRGIVCLSLLLTVWVLAFYVAQTQSRNYGGNTSGLRWAFWLIPLWLLSLIPAMDAWGGKRWFRAISVVLLVVSAFSAAFPHVNPWQRTWLQNILPQGGGSTAAVELKKYPKTWLGDLPDAPQNGEGGGAGAWVEFSGTGAEGRQVVLRLQQAARTQVGGEWIQVISVRHQPGASKDEAADEWRVFLSEEAYRKGGGQALRNVVRPGDPLLGDGPPERAIRFLRGMPAEKDLRVVSRAYLKTSLRKDAIECRVARASMPYRAEKNGPVLEYRKAVWLSDEVPFGVVQIEDTVTDPRDNSVVFRQRLTVRGVSGLIEKKAVADGK